MRGASGEQRKDVGARVRGDAGLLVRFARARGARELFVMKRGCARLVVCSVVGKCAETRGGGNGR